MKSRKDHSVFDGHVRLHIGSIKSARLLGCRMTAFLFFGRHEAVQHTRLAIVTDITGVVGLHGESSFKLAEASCTKAIVDCLHNGRPHVLAVIIQVSRRRCQPVKSHAAVCEAHLWPEFVFGQRPS